MKFLFILFQTVMVRCAIFYGTTKLSNENRGQINKKIINQSYGTTKITRNEHVLFEKLFPKTANISLDNDRRNNTKSLINAQGTIRFNYSQPSTEKGQKYHYPSYEDLQNSHFKMKKNRKRPKSNNDSPIIVTDSLKEGLRFLGQRLPNLPGNEKEYFGTPTNSLIRQRRQFLPGRGLLNVLNPLGSRSIANPGLLNTLGGGLLGHPMTQRNQASNVIDPSFGLLRRLNPFDGGATGLGISGGGPTDGSSTDGFSNFFCSVFRYFLSNLIAG